MAQISLKVQPREVLTKGQRNILRDEGIVPGIVYGSGKKPQMVQVVEKDIRKVFKNAASENIILALTIEQEPAAVKKTVIVKDIQRDPLRQRWLHVDFQEISMTEKLRAMVQVIPVGSSVGVDQQGGTLERVLREVEVECLPTDIPEKIEVDISALDIGKSVYVKDLVVPENVKILTDSELPVVSIAAPQAEIETKTAEEQAAEPEVIREKKVEGEEAAAEEKGKEGAGKKEEKEASKEKEKK